MSVNEIHGRKEPWDVKAVKREIPVETASEPTAVNPTAIKPSLCEGAVDSKKKRSWKKPKDKPMRPLSAYNMFFQNHRERIVAGKTGDPTPEEIQTSIIKMLTSKTRGPKRRQDRVSHGQISFGDLARAIAAAWKTIDPKLKVVYNHYAGQEKIRYKKEVMIWKEKKEREHDAARAAKHSSFMTSSSTFNDSVVSMSSSVTSMSTSMASSYNLSESINSLRGDISMQMNDDVVQRQQDILRQQMGFIDSKPQARAGGGGSDVPKEIPKSNLGVGGNDQEFFPRPIGRNGNVGGMNMNMMGSDKSDNLNPIDGSNQVGSFLDSNLHLHSQQQQLHLNKEQLLLQLQQQQLQQLQQLQQARIETGRLSNVKTTDTVSTFLNSVQTSKMNGRSNREYPTPSLTAQTRSNPSNTNQMHRDQFNEVSNNSKQILRNQFKELEGITLELDRLKEQEQQMQDKIKEHMQTTNANMWANNDSGLGNTFNGTPPVTTSGNYNNSTEFSTSLNDTDNNFSSSGVGSSLSSIFDREIDDKQRIPVRRSRSGDTSVYRGRPTVSDGMSAARREKSKLRQPRRHSMFGSGDTDGGINNTDLSSLANSVYSGIQNDGGMRHQSFNAGGMYQGHQHQQQQQQNNHGSCTNSISALLQLEDSHTTSKLIDEVGRSSEWRHQQYHRRQEEMMQQQQQKLQTLDQLVQEGPGGHDIGSIFNMDLHD